MKKLGFLWRINYPLIIGGILLLFILITSLYPDLLSTADPYGKQRLEFQYDETGGSTFVIPPIKPGKDYPWGTDHLGRDIKSLIIYGCKITMLIGVYSALGRLIIALPLAITAAYKNKVSIWFIKHFNILFSAFPLIVIVLILSQIQLFIDFFTTNKLLMVLILTLFGWSKIAYILTEKVKEILSQDFVEGEIAIGKSKLEIALQNVIPHLIPSLFVLLFLEIALVLQTLAQIGVFSLIASGGYYKLNDINVPLEFDWGSLLVFGHLFFGSDKMYIVIYPVAAFAVSIIGFNLLGEGLRLEFEKRTSRVITFIRKLPSYSSPLRLIYEIKNFHLYRKTVYVKIVCYVLVIGIVFFPHAPSLQEFEAGKAFDVIEDLSSEKYGGRLAGTKQNKELANYIKSELESYGLQPFDGSYIHEYDIARSYNINSSTFKLVNSTSGDKELTFRKDYIVRNPVNFSGTLDIAKVYMREVSNMNLDKWRELKERELFSKLVMIDIDSTLDIRKVNDAIQTITDFIKPKAIILLDDWETEGFASKYTSEFKRLPDTAVISMSKKAGEELWGIRKTAAEITVKADVITNVKGYNVFAYIPGTDDSKKNEYIIIGSPLDFVGDDADWGYPGSLEAGAVAAQMEIAKKLAQSDIKPKQNILFAFWDGSYNDDRGSSYFVNKYVLPGEITASIYIDIGNLALKNENTIFLDSSRIFPNNTTAQKYIKLLKKNARKQDVKLVFSSISSPLMIDLNRRDFQSLLVHNSDKHQVAATLKDNLEAIDKARYKSIGQMLLDTIIDIARGK